MAENDHFLVANRFVVRSPYRRGKAWAFKIRDEKTGRIFQRSSRKGKKADARKEVQGFLEDLDQEDRGEVVAIPFKEAFPAFLEYWKAFRELRPATLRSYEKIYESSLEPFFSNLDVCQIRYSDVEDFMLDRRKAHGNKMVTVTKHIGVLRMFSKWALRRGYIEKDPTEGIRSVQSARVGVAITYAEAARFLEVCNRGKIVKKAKDRRREWTQRFGGRRHLFLFSLIGLYTGLRTKNLLDMSWSKNVDLDGKRLHFTAEEMKGKRSHEVPIHPVLLSVLRRELEGRDSPASPVIGRDVSTGLKTGFSAARKEAKIEKLRPHDLKHTFGTWIEPHCPYSVYKELIQHSLKGDVSLLYAHPTWEQKVAAVSALPDLLNYKKGGGSSTAVAT